MFGFARLAWRFVAEGRQFRTFLHLAAQAYQARPAGICPSCSFAGRFLPAPHMGMAEFCPSCGSLERHRLLALSAQQGFVNFAGARVLHFAPDAIVSELIDRGDAAEQVTADITPGRADLVLNIEQLDVDDCSFDLIVCSHVLEHVDDQSALAELHRVLRPGGKALIMVPLVEGWPETYENPSVTTEDDRTLHFLQWDHVRLYGADLRDRIRQAGFVVREFMAGGDEAARYRLARGERVFLAEKV